MLCLPARRFTGSIPDEWADPQYFTSLRVLDLSNNLLNAPLPNRKWNRLNAFRSIRSIDLSFNLFFGKWPLSGERKQKGSAARQ
jgi:hypothetical protein